MRKVLSWDDLKKENRKLEGGGRDHLYERLFRHPPHRHTRYLRGGQETRRYSGRRAKQRQPLSGRSRALRTHRAQDEACRHHGPLLESVDFVTLFDEPHRWN